MQPCRSSLLEMTSFKDAVQGDGMAAQANDLIAHLREESRQSQFAALVALTLSWSP